MKIPQSMYSRELIFLINKMLAKDPSKRPSVKDILNYNPVRSRVCLGVLVWVFVTACVHVGA